MSLSFNSGDVHDWGAFRLVVRQCSPRGSVTGAASEMFQNAVDNPGILDHRDHLHLNPAVGAEKGIDFQDLPEQARPGAPSADDLRGVSRLRDWIDDCLIIGCRFIESCGQWGCIVPAI